MVWFGVLIAVNFEYQWYSNYQQHPLLYRELLGGTPEEKTVRGSFFLK
jgi:hypothetical protein